MKLGPQKRTPKELKDQLVHAASEYPKAKKKAIENTIFTLESRTNFWLAIFLLGILGFGWALPSFDSYLPGQLNSDVGLSRIVGLFFLSYFAFLFVSKIVFKPSEEELSDESSYITLFSECPRRSTRGWIVTMLSAVHTAAFLAYYASFAESR